MNKTSVAFSNLRAEMGRNNITISDIANEMHLERAAVSRKLAGKSKIGLDEAFFIAKMFPGNNDTRYLFSELLETQQ